MHVLFLALVLLLTPDLLAAQTGNGAPVAIAARDLARGEVLGAEDILYSPPVGAGQPDPSVVTVGWVTRRVIRQGEPLRPPAVVAPHLVRSGQSVTLIWRSHPIEIRLSGRALNPGALGERVRVRVDTHRRFEGVVIGPANILMETRHHR